ncbi:hypothetical protein D9M68_516620 [compost metagenome]
MREPHQHLARMAAVGRVRHLRGGHEGEFAVVVDLRVARHHARRQLAHHGHEAHVARLLRQAADELLQRLGVFGTDGPQHPGNAVREAAHLHQPRRIRMDRHVRIARGLGRFAARLFGQRHAQAAGAQVRFAGVERIDVQGFDVGQFRDQLRHQHQRLLQRFGRHVADARSQHPAPEPAALDQLARQEAVQGRQVHAAVGQGQHGVRPARAEADDRAELRIAPDADRHGARFRLGGRDVHGQIAQRHVEQRQQGPDFGTGELAPAIGAHPRQHLARGRQVRHVAGGLRRLRLQQQLLVVVMGRQHAESVGGRFGRAERRRARVVQHAPQRPHARVAHETGHHRLLRLGRDLRQLARHGRHVRQRIGRQQHQHTVHAGIVEHSVQDGAYALRRQRRESDDRVGAGRVRLQHGRQRALGGGRKFRAQHGGVRADQVHGKLGRPAAVGDKRHAPALGTARVAQHLYRREQLHEVAHPHRTGSAQGGVEDGVAAVGIGPAGLEHDHRLDGGGRAQRAHEFAGRTHVFEVEHDAVRARVAGQVVQHFGQAHHRLVAQRHGGGKADMHVLGPVHDRGHDGARLRQQRHPAGARQHRVLAEIQAGVGTLGAEGPRAQQFAAVFLGPGPAQRLRAARIGIGKLVGQQDHRAGRQGRQAAQRFGQDRRRHANQGQIRPLPRRQALQAVRQVRRGARLAGDHRGFCLERGRQRARRRQRPVGNDHQRTGFEHRGKSVSQHRDRGPGPADAERSLAQPNLKYGSS